MTNDIMVLRLDAAIILLDEAKTIQEKKDIYDMATAAEVYAKRQKRSEELVNRAVFIKVEALRQIGQMLKETPRNTGVRMSGKDIIGSAKIEPPNTSPTLADMGLDKKTSKLAQDIASLSEAQIENIKNGVCCEARGLIIKAHGWKNIKYHQLKIRDTKHIQ